MRLIALAIAFASLFALTACGGDGGPDTDDDDGTCRVEGVVHPAKDCI